MRCRCRPSRPRNGASRQPNAARMDKLLIRGGVPLSGEVRISGAKNAALPIMCASLLSAAPLRLANVPHLRDVTTLLNLIGGMALR